MFGRILVIGILAAAALGLVFWGNRLFPGFNSDHSTQNQQIAGVGRSPSKVGKKPGASEPRETRPASARATGKSKPVGEEKTSPDNSALDQRVGVNDEPIIIPDCRLAAVWKQEVPAQHEGMLDFIGTEPVSGREALLLLPSNLGPALITAEATLGEHPSLRKFVSIAVPTEIGVKSVNDAGVKDPNNAGVKNLNDASVKYIKYRRLVEGDRVQAGQLMAMVDSSLAREDVISKQCKVDASQADFEASEKTRDEAKARFYTQEYLLRIKATSMEEYRGAKATWDKYIYEAISKGKGVALAKAELNQAKTQLRMHEIRPKFEGVIKTIYRRDGESVKSGDNVFLIRGMGKLKAEGLVDVQHLSRLKKGMQVVIEPTVDQDCVKYLNGHMQEITGVAVSQDPKNPLIVSCSEDGTVRVWDRNVRRERRIWTHPSAVRTVACAQVELGGGKKTNVCLAGTADGQLYLWDLDSTAGQPLQTLDKKHKNAVDCVAFSKDGAWFASGGDDHEICLWQVDRDKGQYQFKYKLESDPAHPAHKAAVTSVQFTPDMRLLSAGKDNTLHLWKVEPDKGAHLDKREHRSGEVATLGVSPDGKQVLFDSALSNTLRILSVPDLQPEEIMQNPSGAASFTTMALFSPDAKLILTASASENRLQLWRAATEETTRPYELRRLVPRKKSPATCGAFAPHHNFLVTGTHDRQVLVWDTPKEDEIKQLTGELTYIEPALEANGHQIKVWAEIVNPGNLYPGATVTLVVYPK